MKSANSVKLLVLQKTRDAVCLVGVVCCLAEHPVNLFTNFDNSCLPGHRNNGAEV